MISKANFSQLPHICPLEMYFILNIKIYYFPHSYQSSSLRCQSMWTKGYIKNVEKKTRRNLLRWHSQRFYWLVFSRLCSRDFICLHIFSWQCNQEKPQSSDIARNWAYIYWQNCWLHRRHLRKICWGLQIIFLHLKICSSTIKHVEIKKFSNF